MASLGGGEASIILFYACFKLPEEGSFFIFCIYIIELTNLSFAVEIKYR